MLVAVNQVAFRSDNLPQSVGSRVSKCSHALHGNSVPASTKASDQTVTSSIIGLPEASFQQIIQRNILWHDLRAMGGIKSVLPQIRKIEAG
jgi:hypothetical protein